MIHHNLSTYPETNGAHYGVKCGVEKREALQRRGEEKVYGKRKALLRRLRALLRPGVSVGRCAKMKLAVLNRMVFELESGEPT